MTPSPLPSRPWLFVLLAVVAAVGCVRADPMTLAQTDLGPVTTADLDALLEREPELWEGPLESPSMQQMLPQIVRQCAHECLMRTLIEQRGLNSDPVLQVRLEIASEEFLAERAWHELVFLPSQPRPTEVDEYVREHQESMRPPDQATWRFMLFASSPEGDRGPAQEGAERALAALASGEAFEAVAARLANPPAQGAPGALIGPVEFEGRLVPTIEEALRTQPLGEAGDVLETPVGLVILMVESRELDRSLHPGRVRGILRARLHRERREEMATEVLADLRERYPIEIPAFLSPELPDETVAMRIGPHLVTLGDLRRRSQAAPDPTAALAFFTTPQWRESRAENLLCVVEFEARGRTEDPDIQQGLADLRREETRSALRGTLGGELLPPPTTSELEAFLQAHAEDFEEDTVSAEIIQITHATLAAHASGETPLGRLRLAQMVEQRWTAGEDPGALLLEIGGDPERYDVVVRWSDEWLDEIPALAHEAVASLAPGESDIRISPDGQVFIVAHLTDRRRAVPPLERVRNRVTAAWRRSHPVSLLDAVLEQHGYRPVADLTLLRMDEDGHLVLIESPTED